MTQTLSTPSTPPTYPPEERRGGRPRLGRTAIFAVSLVAWGIIFQIKVLRLAPSLLPLVPRSSQVEAAFLDGNKKTSKKIAMKRGAKSIFRGINGRGFIGSTFHPPLVASQSQSSTASTYLQI